MGEGNLPRKPLKISDLRGPRARKALITKELA